MEQLSVGFAMCGSFCTLEKGMAALERAVQRYTTVIPILSERVISVDTRFGAAKRWRERAEKICGREAIMTIPEAEPIGPQKLLDVLVICPCTGNTLAKLAHGVTDGVVTMAAKAHLRNGKPLVIALSTNDGLSGSAENLGMLLNRKNVYFVPFGQDNSEKKPTSLVAEFEQLENTVECALQGLQIQPLLVTKA